jgi:ABC-type uncharacterized transport system permease subunit
VIQALTVLLPTAYVVVLFAHAHDFVATTENRLTRWRRTYLYAALALHVGFFASLAAAAGGVPHLDRLHVVSAIGLATGLLYALVGEGSGGSRQGRAGVGLFVIGLVLVMQLVASCGAPLTATRHEPDGGFYVVHVGLILLASASLALSGTYGGLYLLLLRQMRGKQFGPLFRSLPSLSELAALTRRSSLVACILLFAAANGGIAWAHARDVEGFSYTHPLVLVALALCVHFLLVALSRRVPGLNPQRASIAAAVGFGVFVLSLFAALVPGKFH